MENLQESGKIYFFKTSNSEKSSESFGPLLEVNSNFDILKSLNICANKALGITSNNELLEWEFDSKQKSRVSSPSQNNKAKNDTNKTKINKKKDFNFLLFKPSYHFHKIKFIQITLNKTMCLGLDIYHNVLVWGQNKEGLLGLGYEITSVDTPTLISKLKEIKEISLSEYHAVVLNNNGNAFSWGLGKYGELGLERSIYTPTPQQILTDTVYSHVFCGNLITCFIDENGKFFYFGVVIKQLGGYGNIVTIKSLLNDQSYQDGKNIYFEKEIEELENESFKNIVIGNGFVALLSKNGLLYVLEYNNKLTMLYNKYFLYNITVASNEIYGLARERPKVDKNQKDNYYLFKWNSKFSSENDLYSDIWHTTIWKFKNDFQLISNCKLLETNNNKNILLLKDEDEKYNLTNSIFNPHRKNLEMSTQNNDLTLLEKSVNNPNLSAFGDLIINKKIIPDKFLEYINKYDDSYNIKYKKCKIKLNIRTGMDNSSSYLNNNKSRTVTQYLKHSQNYNINGNNKNSSSLSPYIEQNMSHNNNLFSESYNAQIDLGKENDNVNIYKSEDDDIMNEKEKELNKYKNEVDNIINNFKSKKDIQKSIHSSQNNTKRSKHNENSLKYLSQNNSNQNERYSNNGQNYYNQDEDKFVQRNKFKLSKEEIINLMKLDKKKKEYMSNNSNYNDSLSRVRNNIISMKDKIKFKDKALNKINNLFTLGEEEEEEDDSVKNNNIENSDDNNINSNRYKHNSKSKKKRNKNKYNKFMRSPSFSVIKSRNKKSQNSKDGNNINNSNEFINIEDLDTFKRKRYNSKDSIFLKDKNNEFGNNKMNNLGDKYISRNNSDDESSNINESKNKTIKIKNKYKGKKISQRNKNIKNKGEEEFEEEDDEEEDEEGIEFFEEAKDNKNNKRKIKKIKCKIKIRIKKSNSFTNEDFNKFNKPKGFKILGDSLEEINIKSRNNKNSNSLDKIDKRKSISNILFPSNIIYNKKKKKHMKKYNNKGKIEENDEELEQSNDNIKKNKNKNKNKIINNKKQFNQGKKNLNKDEESKNSYKDSDYISESDNGTNSQKNRINKLKNNMKAKKKNEESKNERNNKNNKIKNFKMNSNLIAINKFSLMYFCDLIEHYMKKKSFALCARQIANYQKYLEIKFSLKILFRVVMKRIIFYKLKFMHRYKRINKFLIKNRIKNIKYVNKKKK